MNIAFKRNRLLILTLAAISSAAAANTTFEGDVNQVSSSDPKPSYSGNIIVGDADTSGTPQNPAGTLVIDDGTQASGNLSLVIGNASDSSGSVTITGSDSLLSLDRNAIIGRGRGSYGEMNIQDGATVNSTKYISPAAGIVGSDAGSIGVMNVSGSDSAWNSKGVTVLGDSGKGTLNISDSGTVNTLTLRVGNSAGSEGIINVDGSTLDVTGSSYIGNSGTGTVNIVNSGQVTSSDTNIGGPGGNGTLVISGAGSIFNSNLHTTAGTDVGGTGQIAVTDGGTLNASLTGTPTDGKSLVLGNVAKATGDVLVTGENSVINATGGITVIGKAGNGSLTLQDNGALDTAGVVIASASGATGVLDIGSAFGSAATNAGSLNPNATITFGDGHGTLNFNHTNSNYVFANLIQGNGDVEVNGGTTVLTATNTWSGTTAVNLGTLRASAVNTFSPDAAYDVADGGTLDLSGFNQSTESLTNAGTVNIAGSQPGATLTVNGNYAGNNGLLIFGTALGDDSSATDHLIVTGNTSGNSRVAVTNLGGTGAQTLNGIEFISVGGDSAGAFTQQGVLSPAHGSTI